jgi:hypothetical protein
MMAAVVPASIDRHGEQSGLFGWRVAVTRQNPRIALPLTVIAQIVVVIPVLASITDVATSANLPLADAALLASDRELGPAGTGVERR